MDKMKEIVDSLNSSVFIKTAGLAELFSRFYILLLLIK